MVFFNNRSLHRILGFRSFIHTHVQAGPDMLSRMIIMQCNQRSSTAETRAASCASAKVREIVPNNLSKSLFNMEALERVNAPGLHWVGFLRNY